jgi:hypothetical protein
MTPALSEPAFAMLAGLLVLAVLAAIGVVAARVLPVLLARYDGQTMRVEPPGEALPAGSRDLSLLEKAVWQQLQRWCQASAGPGGVPFWTPWRSPQVEQPLGVALMCSELPPTGQRSLIERFSRELDGSVELARTGGAWAGLLLRLRVKLDDVQWWRTRQASDPWDCGYLVGDAAARQALRRFRPRRATLLVATGDWPFQALRQDIEALHARRAQLHHPVRVLVMAPQGPLGPEPRAGIAPASMAAWSGLPCEMSLIR